MKFKCDNKECKIYSNTEFNYPVVRTKYTDKGSIYLDEKGYELICPTCGKPLVKIKEFKGFATWIGSFNSKTPEEKREILKKREREYSKRDKQFHERKKAIDNGEIS